MLNTAVVTPMPSASASTAIVVTNRDRRTERAANLRSWSNRIGRLPDLGRNVGVRSWLA
jgi:hypothetical protein